MRKWRPLFPNLRAFHPTARRVIGATVEELARLGIIRARSATLIALARAFDSGLLRLEPGNHTETALNQLAAIPGVGPWTAQYLAMRAMHWPDAFPKEDIVVRKALGGISARQAQEMSQVWRPWRSYTVMHIWRSSAGPGVRLCRRGANPGSRAPVDAVT